MRRIQYAGGTFVTGDVAAGAICDYAATLANAGRAASVVVPVLAEDGRQEEVEMVIGPSSQLLSEAIESEREAPDGVEFAAHLRDEIARLSWRPPLTSSLADWEL